MVKHLLLNKAYHYNCDNIEPQTTLSFHKAYNHDIIKYDIVVNMTKTWASQVVLEVKNRTAVTLSRTAEVCMLPGQQRYETWVRSLSQEDPREEGMQTHASTLAWRIPMDRGAWQAIVHRSHRVRHN